jgi:hypothetical protein
MNRPETSQDPGQAAISVSKVPCLRVSLLALAAAMLGTAILIKYGTFTPTAISFVAVALVLALAGTLLPDGARRVAWTPRAMWVVLLACFALQFAQGICRVPVDGRSFTVGAKVAGESAVVWLPVHMTFFWSVLVIAAVVSSQMAGKHPPLGRFTLPLLIVLEIVAAVWVINRDRPPFIDVFDIQQDSSQALLAGRDPYAIHFDSIYDLDSTRKLYAPGDFSPDGRRLLFGYVYMPLTLLLTIPGYLLGDVRYSLIAALAIAAALMGLMRPGRVGWAAAVGLLFMPRTFNVIDLAWTEPLTVALLALTVYFAIHIPKLAPFAFGLMLASKQHMPFAVLLAPLLFGWEWRPLLRAVIYAIVTALVVTLPLVFEDVGAFIHSAVLFQLHQPFRPYALSFMVIGHQTADNPPSGVVGFLALVVAIALVLWRLRPSPSNFAAGLALSYFAFFAFNKHAFMNYYFFVIAALWCSVAAMEWPAPSATMPQLIE